MPTLAADPYPWPYDGDLTPANTALLVIDMQTDFCGVGGYVDTMGYDLSLTRAPIEPIRRVLEAMRNAGFWIIHTREGHRPDLGFAGAWLYTQGGAAAVLHVYWDRPMPTQRTGVIDHMAFSAQDLKAVKARFDERGVAYDLRRQAQSGTWQLFSFDPNGARVELDFDASESL